MQFQQCHCLLISFNAFIAFYSYTICSGRQLGTAGAAEESGIAVAISFIVFWESGEDVAADGVDSHERASTCAALDCCCCHGIRVTQVDVDLSAYIIQKFKFPCRFTLFLFASLQQQQHYHTSSHTFAPKKHSEISRKLFLPSHSNVDYIVNWVSYIHSLTPMAVEMLSRSEAM